MSEGPVFVEGGMPIRFLYTHGIAGEKFANGLKKGKFIASVCPQCGNVFLPARMFCEFCFKEISKFVDIPNEGIVYSVTSTPDGDVVAAIMMEGTDTLLFHKVKPNEIIDIGSCVKAVFKPQKERKGSITDIAYFEAV
jgi:uncharacterized OB-fold protein